MSKMDPGFLSRVIKQINKVDGVPSSACVRITQGRFKSYFQMKLSRRLELTEALKIMSAQVGGMELHFKPQAFDEEELLESIQLNNPRAFLAHCNEPIIFDQIQVACELLNSLSITLPEWASVFLDQSCVLWQSGKKAFGCSPEQAPQLRDAFLFIEWLNNTLDFSEISMDMRTVSTLLYGTSKHLQGLANTIAALYRDQLPEELQTLKPIKIIEFLGVYRFPRLFPIKGNLTLLTPTGSLSAASASPYVAIPPDGILKIVANTPPDYVLFIENETTFNRYTREVSDNGWVFYTSGFPSLPWQRLFVMLKAAAGEHVPFYHWGDVDTGGYRILRFMRELMDVDLIPYRMSPSDLPNVITTQDTVKIELAALSDILLGYDGALGELHDVVLALSETTVSVPWVEQEHFPIIPPRSVG